MSSVSHPCAPRFASEHGPCTCWTKPNWSSAERPSSSAESWKTHGFDQSSESDGSVISVYISCGMKYPFSQTNRSIGGHGGVPFLPPPPSSGAAICVPPPAPCSRRRSSAWPPLQVWHLAQP